MTNAKDTLLNINLNDLNDFPIVILGRVTDTKITVSIDGATMREIQDARNKIDLRTSMYRRDKEAKRTMLIMRNMIDDYISEVKKQEFYRFLEKGV